MPLTTAVHEVCRVHRFDGQTPIAVVSGELCADGHLHQTDRRLYRCNRCGFPMTLPLEG